MHNLLGTLLVTIFGLIIAFSVITLLVMCIVGCIQQCKQAQKSRHGNRRALSLPQNDMETRDQPTEQDCDEEESGEDNRARDLSQAPPPAYRNAKQYQSVDLEHIEVIIIKETYYSLSVHCEPVDTTSLPPDYTSQRLSISVAPEKIEGQQPPPAYNTAQLELTTTAQDIV